jgi:hypothetical protein
MTGWSRMCACQECANTLYSCLNCQMAGKCAIYANVKLKLYTPM